MGVVEFSGLTRAGGGHAVGISKNSGKLRERVMSAVRRGCLLRVWHGVGVSGTAWDGKDGKVWIVPQKVRGSRQHQNRPR